MKAFAFRLVDDGLSEADWLESLGSFLALRPPSKWKDGDEDTFNRELETLAGRFKRAESLSFGSSVNVRGKMGLRIAVTQADGSERQEVIQSITNEEVDLKQFQNRIAVLIPRDTRLEMALISAL